MFYESVSFSLTCSASRIAKFGGATIKFLADTLKQLPKQLDLDPTSQLVISNFLKTETIIVYMDDLDRGWQGRREDVQRISALLNAVRDIVRENPGIHFKISLRSDVYYLVRTSDESTDKIEGSVIWQTWTNHEILVLLVKRIETYFGNKIDEEALLKLDQREIGRYLNPVMEERFTGLGHWAHAPIHRVLMSLIRKRPRDLVKLCTLAARNTNEKKRSKITTNNFENIFEEYSQGRLQDTINEFRSELPDIERLLVNMKPNKRERTAKEGYVYKTNALLEKISNICEMGDFRYNNGVRVSTKGLASFLYKINFLTVRRATSNGIVRKYFEESRYLSSDFYDFGFDWRYILHTDGLSSQGIWETYIIR
jgi:hypothetical protein